jgi:hypothetical protein
VCEGLAGCTKACRIAFLLIALIAHVSDLLSVIEENIEKHACGCVQLKICYSLDDMICKFYNNEGV